MSEYIIDDSKVKKIEIVRCKDCVLSEDSQSAPAFRLCTFWDKLVPWNGFCYIGQKGEKNG